MSFAAVVWPSSSTVTLLPATKMGVEIYIASVAKSQNGVDKAYQHFPASANKYSITLLMSNCVGYCDNFESDGENSVWNNSKGNLVGHLDDKDDGVLIFDTDTEEMIYKLI